MDLPPYFNIFLEQLLDVQILSLVPEIHTGTRLMHLFKAYYNNRITQ